MSENASETPEQEQDSTAAPEQPPPEEQQHPATPEDHTAQQPPAPDNETQEHSPVSKTAQHPPVPPRPPADTFSSPKPASSPAKEPPSDSTPKPAPPAQAPVKETKEPSSSAPPGPEHPQETKAKGYLVQAEKKMKSAQSFFGGLFGGAAKMEDAADLYVRAANAFKVAKKFTASGDAFCTAADIQFKLDVKHEAGTNLVEAGQVLKKEDPKRAVDCYKRAAEVYTDMGRFSMSARYHNSIAEIYEGELADYKQSIIHYEQAADYYKGEDSTGSANRCLLKVAHMCAQLQQFDKAAEIFEEVGRSSLENTLLRYSAKEHFFKAGICLFCKGSEYVRDALEGYKQIHPGFEGTRELKLLQDLLGAHAEEDPDKFADIIKDYDAISRIDQWLTAQLLHIKKSIHPDVDIN